MSQRERPERAPISGRAYSVPASATAARPRVSVEMPTVACLQLPDRLVARLTATLGPAAVRRCDNRAALAIAVGGGVTLVVVHPTSAPDPAEFLAWLETLGRPTEIVVYSEPSLGTLQQSFAWARAGARTLVLEGIDDQPERLRRALVALAPRRAVDAFLERIEPALAKLPPILAAAIVEMFRDPQASDGVRSLVARAGMTSRSIERWLGRAGLAPASRLVSVARLLRARIALAAPSVGLARAAAEAGLSSERVLQRHSRALLDLTAAALRELPEAELRDRLVTLVVVGGAA